YVIPSFTFLSPRPPTFTLFPYTTLFRSVESKPGADGAIGTAEVVRAAPDGYTLLLGPTAVYAVTPHLFKNLGFDPLTALDPISLLADAPLLAVIGANVPAKSLKEDRKSVV